MRTSGPLGVVRLASLGALALAFGSVGCGESGSSDTTDTRADVSDVEDTDAGDTADTTVASDAGDVSDTDAAADVPDVICVEDEDCAGLFPSRKKCQVVLCNTANGKCGLFSKVNGATCTDYNACTDVDACKDGECVPGEATNCNDQNPCTWDHCEIRNGCKHDPVQNTCSDGQACTKDDTCKDGVCVGVRDDCDDLNPCTLDSCDAQLGCQHAPQEDRCDDGNPCTRRDRCAEGRCTGEAVPDCVP